MPFAYNSTFKKPQRSKGGNQFLFLKYLTDHLASFHNPNSNGMAIAIPINAPGCCNTRIYCFQLRNQCTNYKSY